MNSKNTFSDQRTPGTIELNKKLEIVKVDHDYKFRTTENKLDSTNGYCFYVERKGYVAFDTDTTPYTPVGGVDALQSILNDGGFLNYKGMKFLQPINEIGVQRISCD